MMTMLRLLYSVLEIVLLLPLRILVVVVATIILAIINIGEGNFKEGFRHDMKDQIGGAKEQWACNIQWIKSGGEYRTIWDKEEG